MRTNLLILSFIIASAFSLVQPGFSQTATVDTTGRGLPKADQPVTNQPASTQPASTQPGADQTTANQPSAFRKTDSNLNADVVPVVTSKSNWWKDKIYLILAFVGGGFAVLCFQFLFKEKPSGSSRKTSAYGELEYTELKKKKSDLQIAVTQLSRDKKKLEDDLSALKAAANQQPGNPPVKDSGTQTKVQPGAGASGQIRKQPITQPQELPFNQSQKQPEKGLYEQNLSPQNNQYQDFVKEEKSPTIELEVTNIIPKELAAEKASAEKPVNVLYFPNPNRSGDFKNAGGKPTFIEGTSIYKFSLISPTEAHFEFCEEKSAVATAINNRNDLILSVAEESNAYTTNATKILIADDQKGKAVLEGISWRITDKAKIKYI